MAQIDHLIKKLVHSQILNNSDVENEEQESKKYSSHKKLEAGMYQSETDMHEAFEE